MYPFVIYQESGTGYIVLSFIDFPHCYVVGDTVEEVLSMKDEVLETYLETYKRIYKKLPEPTDLSDENIRRKLCQR